MKINVEIKGQIPLNLDIKDIVKEINELPLFERWQIVSKILNNIHLRNIDELNNSKKIIIKNFLKQQTKIYNYGNNKH